MGAKVTRLQGRPNKGAKVTRLQGRPNKGAKVTRLQGRPNKGAKVTGSQGIAARLFVLQFSGCFRVCMHACMAFRVCMHAWRFGVLASP